MLFIEDKDVEKKAQEYTEKEEAFYK